MNANEAVTRHIQATQLIKCDLATQEAIIRKFLAFCNIDGAYLFGGAFEARLSDDEANIFIKEFLTKT